MIARATPPGGSFCAIKRGSFVQHFPAFGGKVVVVVALPSGGGGKYFCWNAATIDLTGDGAEHRFERCGCASSWTKISVHSFLWGKFVTSDTDTKRVPSVFTPRWANTKERREMNETAEITCRMCDVVLRYAVSTRFQTTEAFAASRVADARSSTNFPIMSSLGKERRRCCRRRERVFWTTTKHSRDDCKRKKRQSEEQQQQGRRRGWTICFRRSPWGIKEVQG